MYKSYEDKINEEANRNEWYEQGAKARAPKKANWVLRISVAVGVVGLLVAMTSTPEEIASRHAANEVEKKERMIEEAANNAMRGLVKDSSPEERYNASVLVIAGDRCDFDTNIDPIVARELKKFDEYTSAEIDVLGAIWGENGKSDNKTEVCAALNPGQYLAAQDQ